MAEKFQPVFTRFTKGSYIFVEGNPNSNKFYLIREGKVRISRELDWETSEGNIVVPGGMFGVVSVMASHSNIDTAIAVTDVLALVVERKQYGDLVYKNNKVAMKTIKLFSQRLRKLDEALSQHALKGTSSNDPSHLYHVGLFFEQSGKGSQAMYAYLRYLSHCPDAYNIDEVKSRLVKLKSRVTFNYPNYPPDTMVQSYPKGSIIFAEGETGQNLYIIQSGSIKISKISNNQEVVLAVLIENDIFGEMAMLEDKPRSATAEVYEDCTLLVINRANFTKLITDQLDMVVRLTSLMAERIWLLYRQLANTLIENPVGRVYDALLTQLEKDRLDLTSNNPYMCSFGFKELVGMTGISENDNRDLYKRVTAKKTIIQVNDKICISNVNKFFVEADYYRKTKKTS